MDAHKTGAGSAGETTNPAHGVYAVICRATGEAWVGGSTSLDTQQDRLWSALELGTSPYDSLQAEWLEHGAQEFRYEELERLREDLPECSRSDEVRKRQRLWLVRLHASSLS